MVTFLAYVIVVAIVSLVVIMGAVVVSLLLGDENSPEIDLRDIEGHFPEGQNPDGNA